MKKVLLVYVLIFVLLPICSQEKKVITVLDFSVNNVSESDMASITYFLSAALFDTGKYRVIDASQRNAILEELSFSASGCVDESCQLEIGKLLSAEMIVVGDIGYLGGRYILTAKLLETETSDTVNTAKGIFQDLGELIDNMNDFANDLADMELTSPAPVVAEAEEPAETEPVEMESEPAAAEVTETPETAEAEPAPAPAPAEKPAPEILETPEKEKSGIKLSSRKIIGLSCAAGGVLVAALGGYLFSDFMGYYNGEFTEVKDAYDLGVEGYDGGDWDTLTLEERQNFFDGLWSDYEAASDEKNSKLLTSAVVTGGGLVMLGVGIVLYFLPEKAETDDQRVSFLFEPEINRTSFGLTLSY